jgi:hypothetical protein
MNADDQAFYQSGLQTGIYSYFRGGVPLTGTITKPTGRKDQVVSLGNLSAFSGNHMAQAAVTGCKRLQERRTRCCSAWRLANAGFPNLLRRTAILFGKMCLQFHRIVQNAADLDYS